LREEFLGERPYELGGPLAAFRLNNIKMKFADDEECWEVYDVGKDGKRVE
jgi:hypothetical protein